MKLYWTYSRTNLKPADIRLHEASKTKLSNEKYHIGGLQRVPIFTHCITPTGHLIVLNFKPGNEIHLAIIGGLDEDFCYKNTMTREQLLTLGNLVRYQLSLGDIIEEGDLSNFDLEIWLKGVNK